MKARAAGPLRVQHALESLEGFINRGAYHGGDSRRPEWAQEFAFGIRTCEGLEVGGLGPTLREMCFGGNPALGKGAGSGLGRPGRGSSVTGSVQVASPLMQRRVLQSTSWDFHEGVILTYAKPLNAYFSVVASNRHCFYNYNRNVPKQPSGLIKARGGEGRREVNLRRPIASGIFFQQGNSRNCPLHPSSLSGESVSLPCG